MVAGLALAVRLAAFLGASSVDPASMMTPDSYEYDRLARTLLDHGRFAVSADAPAQRRRMPGFPLLIAGVYGAAGEDARAVVFVGIALSVLTVCLTSWIAWRLWGHWPALVAGLLLALDLPSVTASRLLLTETPFTVLIVAGIAVGVGLVTGERPRAWQGVLMGRAARVGGAHATDRALPPSARRRLAPRFRSFPGLESARCLPDGRFVRGGVDRDRGGWQLRNQRALGAAAASDEPVKILFHVRAVDILVQRDGIPVEQARAEIRSLTQSGQGGNLSKEDHQLRIALGLIAQHPLLFLWTQVRWLPELLLGTGAAGLSAALRLEDAADLPHRVARVMTNVAPAVHLLALYVGTAWCLLALGKESASRRVAVLLVAGLVVYFVVLSAGPMAYSRLRVPFAPLLAVCAARGLQVARERGRSRG